MLLCAGVLSHCQHLITLSSFMCQWKKLQCCGTCVTGRIPQYDHTYVVLGLNSASDII